MNNKVKSYLLDARIYLVILLLISFIYRILSLNYFSFWIDETTTAYISEIVQYKLVPILNSGVFYSSGTLNLYIIALFYKLFGTSEFIARLVSVIFGVLSILITFYLAKELTKDNKIALITAILMTFSTIEIIWSRQARMYSQLQFFFLCALFFFYKNQDSLLNKKNVIILSILILFSMLTHIVSVTLFIIFFTYLLLTNKINKESIKRHKKKIFLGFVMSIPIILLFMLYYDIEKITKIVSSIQWGQVLEYIGYVNSKFKYIFYFGIIGLIYLFNFSRKVFLYSILILVIPFLFVATLIPAVYDRYIFFFLVPIMFISISSLIVYTANIISKNNNLSKVLAALFTILILLSGNAMGVFNLNYKDLENYRLQREAPQTNYRLAYSFIKERLNEEDNIISITQGLTPAAFYLGDRFNTNQNVVFDNTTEPFLSSYKSWSVNYNERYYDVYTNSTIATNFEELKGLLESTDGTIWIVFDKSKRSHLDKQFMDFINEQAILNSEASDNTISTYSWKRASVIYSVDLSNLNNLEEKFKFENTMVSKSIVENKTVIYPTADNVEAYAIYQLKVDKKINDASLEVYGRKRDQLHTLYVSISPDGENFEKVLSFQIDKDETIGKDITQIVRNSDAIWIKFTFVKDKMGDNYPRVYSFKLVLK